MSTLSRTESVLWTINLLPRGICLFRVDPLSGLSTGPLATPLYLELMNQDAELFRENGVVSGTRHVHDSDRILCDQYVIECMRRLHTQRVVNCVLACRIFTDRYRWVRQWTINSTLPDGAVTYSCLSERFDEGASRIADSLNQERSYLMLASLAKKAFDVCVWTDERLNYGGGIPLESLVPLDQHKLALRQYVKERREENQANLPSPRIRLRMNMGKQLLVEVDFHAFPIKPVGFLVGIKRVDSQTPCGKAQARRSRKHRPSVVDTRTLNVPSEIVGEVYRNVLSDLAFSLDSCETIRSWLVPVRKPTAPEAITDYLLMAIPEHVQGDFSEAAAKADFHCCSQLLAFTIYGNANILSPCRWRQLTANTDLIHVVLRFFMNMVPLLRHKPARQFNLLSLVHDAQKSILSKRLDRPCYISTVYRFAIGLLSEAALNPAYYSTETALRWLRSTFMEALTLPIDPEAGDRKMILVYWICLLWAGTMHEMNRADEALALLRQTERELDKFRERYPFSSLGNRLMSVCLSNLKTSAGFKERRKIAKKLSYITGGCYT
jgi:hypothetical protein